MVPDPKAPPTFGHAKINGHIQSISRDNARRSTAGLAHLELLAAFHPAAISVDELPQGNAHVDFHDLRGVDLADNLVNLGARSVRRAQTFVPFPALGDDGRDEARVSTLLTTVGLCHKPATPGKGGFERG